MGKPDVRHFDDFTGLDLRSGNETTPPSAALEASNVYLTTGSDYLTRPPLRQVAALNPASRGLYVSGDRLRAAIPWDQDTAPVDELAPVAYDILRSPALTPPTLVDPAVSTLVDISDSASWKGRPYLVATLDTGGEITYEHHLLPGGIRDTRIVELTNGSATVSGLPAPRSALGYPVRFIGVGTGYNATYRVTAANTITPVWPGTTTTLPTEPREAMLYDDADTLVAVPFDVGPAVAIAAQKVFASGQDNQVWFSATDDPTDWTTLNDAGFLPTSSHIDGDQPISGLGVFKGELLVMAKRAMQVWTIDPDPAQMALAGNIGGSGCDFPGTVANTGGDVFLFATGQFRSVSAVVTTGQAKDGDIGANIRSLTRSITRDNSTYEMVAVWWAELQCYVAFQGTTAYCFVYSPQMQVRGWTTWTLPVTVKNAAVWDGKLYVRATDHTLWVMDPDSDDYTGEPAAFEWRVRPAWNTLDDTRRMKLLRQMILPQEGTSSLRLYYTPGDANSYEDFGTLAGSSTGGGRLLINAMTDIVSPEFSGTGYWRLGAFSLYYEAGNLT